MYDYESRSDRDDRRHRMGGNRRGNRRDLDRDRDRDDDGPNSRFTNLEEVVGQVRQYPHFSRTAVLPDLRDRAGISFSRAKLGNAFRH